MGGWGRGNDWKIWLFQRVRMPGGTSVEVIATRTALIADLVLHVGTHAVYSSIMRPHRSMALRATHNPVLVHAQRKLKGYLLPLSFVADFGGNVGKF